MSRAGEHVGPGFSLCEIAINGADFALLAGRQWRDAIHRPHNMESIVTEWLSERVYLDQSDMHF
jgi:hypothetical protein